MIDRFESDVSHRLKRCSGTKIALLGIGNELRRDDSVGLAVIDGLGALIDDPSISLVKCHEVPENFTGRVKRFNPACVILIDAADFGGAPGEVRVFELNELEGIEITTHRPSLAVLGEYLQSETSAGIFVIGIQPEDQEFGEGLSPAVRRASTMVAGALRTALNRFGAKKD
ncbi:MAG: hydrogenase 3 maturation endopeptidase HyCI [Halobacteriota archaeon]